MRERVTNGKWRSYDVVGGAEHLCGEAWKGIDRAMGHKPHHNTGRLLSITPSLRLFQMLRDGPVFQSELPLLSGCGGSASNALQSLRKYYLIDSGLRVVGNWCCVLAHGHHVRSTERVYQLERAASV